MYGFRLTCGIIVVLYEINSKKLNWPNTFGTSLYIQKCIKKEPYLKIDNFQ